MDDSQPQVDQDKTPSLRKEPQELLMQFSLASPKFKVEESNFRPQQNKLDDSDVMSEENSEAQLDSNVQNAQQNQNISPEALEEKAKKSAEAKATLRSIFMSKNDSKELIKVQSEQKEIEEMFENLNNKESQEDEEKAANDRIQQAKEKMLQKQKEQLKTQIESDLMSKLQNLNVFNYLSEELGVEKELLEEEYSEMIHGKIESNPAKVESIFDTKLKGKDQDKSDAKPSKFVGDLTQLKGIIEEDSSEETLSKEQISKKIQKASQLEQELLLAFVSDGQFIVQGELVQSSKSALCCKMTNKNKCRQRLISIVENKWFDRFILVFICINTLNMAFFNNMKEQNRKNDEQVNFRLQDALFYISKTIDIVFCCEAFLKICAHGFIIGQHTYLRDMWNLLDFFIVGTLFLGDSFAALRVLRLLRPLRIIKRLPQLRKFTEALFSSMPAILNVLLFLVFIIVLFAVIGVQLFAGNLYYQCRTTPEPLPGATSWEIAQDSGFLVCNPRNSQCPEGTYCGSPYDYGLDKYSDEIQDNGSLQFGIAQYDDIFQASLAVFQTITFDGWTTNMYNLMDTVNYKIVPILYCTSIVFVCSFFMLNLVVAVILDKYTEIDDAFGNMRLEQLEQGRKQLAQLVQKKEQQQKQMMEKVRKGILDQMKQNKKPSECNEGGEEELVQKDENGKQDQQQDSPAQNSSNRQDKNSSLQFLVASNQSSEELKANNQKLVQEDKQFLQNVPKNDFQGIAQENKIEKKQTRQFKSMGANFQNVMQKSIKNRLSKKEEDLQIIKEKMNKLQDSAAKKDLFNLSGTVENALKLDDYQNKQIMFNQIAMKNTLMIVKQQQANLEKRKALRDRAGLAGENSIKSFINFKIDNMLTDLSPEDQDAINNLIEPQNTNQALKEIKGSSGGTADEAQVSKKQQKLNPRLLFISRMKTLIQSVGDNNQKSEFKVDKEKEKSQEGQQQQNMFEEVQLKQIADAQLKLLKDDLLEMRAKQNCLFKCCYAIQKSNYFATLINIVIIGNTILLAMDEYPANEHREYVISIINSVFSIIFIFEMVIKVLGLGWLEYIGDRANLFDFILVCISIIDTILENFGNSGRNLSVLKVLRVLRLLRIFKLAKIWSGFYRILVIMGKTLEEILHFGLIIFLFVLMYSVFGMQVFGYKVMFDKNGLPAPQDLIQNSTYEELKDLNYQYPQWNFNSFYEGSLVDFVLLANDGWTAIYFDYYRALGATIPTIYFVSLVIVGQYILMSVFLTIILKGFDDDSREEESSVAVKKLQGEYQNFLQTLKETLRNILQRAPGCCRLCCSCLTKKSEPFKKGQKTRSLFIFSSESKFRKLIQKIVGNQDDDQNDKPTEQANWYKQQNIPQKKATNYFDTFIMTVIILSSIDICLQNPLNDPDSDWNHYMDIFDIICTTIFTIECLLKVIAFGFISCGPDSYIRNPWNILDFSIVAFCLVILVIPFGQNASFFKILRLSRLLRPLRIISKNEGLKTSIMAIGAATPKILNQLLIVLLFFFIFAIIGVNLMKGEFEYCATDNVLLSHQQIEQLIDTHQDCINYGGEWVTFYMNYNNLGEAMSRMVALSQTVNWMFNMYNSMDVQGPKKQPIHKNSPAQALYHIGSVLFIAMFTLNMFSGVVVSNFNRQSNKLREQQNTKTAGKQFQSERSKELASVLNKAQQFKPIVRNQEPTQKWRKCFYSLADHRAFEITVLILVVLNTILLSFKWVGMSENHIFQTKVINEVFSVLFIIEAMIKIIAFGKLYFKDPWNLLDFALVVMTIIMGIVVFAFEIEPNPVLQVLRCFRLFKLLRLFRNQQMLQNIVYTFLSSLPALLNIGALLSLFMFIYAILGVQLFADIKLNGPMHKYLNFQSVGMSLITLLRIVTGEAWNDLLHALSMEFSVTNQCIDHVTYQDYVDNGNETIGCGRPVTAKIFFYSYILSIAVVFLNLFIAVIIDGYVQIVEDEKKVFSSRVLHWYQKCWSKFDPTATGLMPKKDLLELLEDLDPPLGWQDEYSFNDNYKKQYASLIKCEEIEKNGTVYIKFDKVIEELILIYIITKEVDKSLPKTKDEQEKKAIEMLKKKTCCQILCAKHQNKKATTQDEDEQNQQDNAPVSDVANNDASPEHQPLSSEGAGQPAQKQQCSPRTLHQMEAKEQVIKDVIQLDVDVLFNDKVDDQDEEQERQKQKLIDQIKSQLNLKIPKIKQKQQIMIQKQQQQQLRNNQKASEQIKLQEIQMVFSSRFSQMVSERRQ